MACRPCIIANGCDPGHNGNRSGPMPCGKCDGDGTIDKVINGQILSKTCHHCNGRGTCREIS